MSSTSSFLKPNSHFQRLEKEANQIDRSISKGKGRIAVLLTACVDFFIKGKKALLVVFSLG